MSKTNNFNWITADGIPDDLTKKKHRFSKTYTSSKWRSYDKYVYEKQGWRVYLRFRDDKRRYGFVVVYIDDNSRLKLQIVSFKKRKERWLHFDDWFEVERFFSKHEIPKITSEDAIDNELLIHHLIELV